MHEIETWVEEAARRQSISVRKLSGDEAELVQHQAMSIYVKIPDPRAWWLNLTRPIDKHYDRNSVKLSEVIPAKSGLSWFIPETDGGRLPVYEVDVEDVERLIDDCPGFEYNIVAKDYSWLVIETDHDQFYVCRAADNLPTITQ